jgi:multiple sugar transport system substrate-binding protein
VLPKPSFAQMNRRQALSLGFGLVATGSAAAAPANTLTIAAYPAIDKIVSAALTRWKQLHPNIAVNIISRQFNDHHTAMTTALSTSFQLPDLIALEVGYVGRFAQGGGLEDLASERFGVAKFQDQLTPYAYDQARGRHASVIAIPTDIGPGTLLYRADILARVGLEEGDLTKSWDSYVESGIRIKAKTGAYLVAHARDVKDIVIRGGLTPGDGLYFDRHSNASVATERFARAFELAKKVRQHKLDARVSAWSNEWAEGFKRGTLATQMSGAWLAGHLGSWLAPATHGRWRAAHLPDGVFAAYGGTFLALPRAAAAEKKALAWEFAQMIALDRNIQLDSFVAHDSFPALLSAQTDPFFDKPIAFLGEQKARLIWREATRKITAVRVHKQDAFADEVINTELDKVLDRGKAIGSALADAQRLLEKRARR